MSFTVTHPAFPDVKKAGLDAKQRDAHIAQGWLYDAPKFDSGGVLPKADGVVHNTSGKPEKLKGKGKPDKG